MTEAEYLACGDPAAMLEELRKWDCPVVGDPSSARPRISDRKLRMLVAACCRAARVTGDFVTATGELEQAADKTPFVASGLMGRFFHPEWDAATLARWAVRDCVQAPAFIRCVAGNPFRPVTLPNNPSCPACEGKGRFVVGSGEDAEPFRCRCCPWLTPTVISLAAAAYDERPGKKCGECAGSGEDQRESASGDCPACRGMGRIEDGTLDPLRLVVLSDALEEAGCTEESLLRHLRGEESVPNLHYQRGSNPPVPLAWRPLPGPHVRGCFSLDHILGKE